MVLSRCSIIFSIVVLSVFLRVDWRWHHHLDWTRRDNSVGMNPARARRFSPHGQVNHRHSHCQSSAERLLKSMFVSHGQCREEKSSLFVILSLALGWLISLLFVWGWVASRVAFPPVGGPNSSSTSIIISTFTARLFGFLIWWRTSFFYCSIYQT